MKPPSPPAAEIEALTDAERAALVERVCASLAHALADRLMVIAGRIDLLAEKQADGDAKRSLEEIRAQIRQANQLLTRARRFGEHLRPPVAPTDLSQCIADALEEIRPLAEARRIEVVGAATKSPSAPALPNRSLLVVLRALLGFAVARCASGTTVNIAASVAPVERGGREIDCVVVRLELPPGTSFPRDLRSLVDPWLSEPEGDAKARLLLALGVGTVRDGGGWAEISEDGRPTLTVHWPLAAGVHPDIALGLRPV